MRKAKHRHSLQMVKEESYNPFELGESSPGLEEDKYWDDVEENELDMPEFEAVKPPKHDFVDGPSSKFVGSATIQELPALEPNEETKQSKLIFKIVWQLMVMP